MLDVVGAQRAAPFAESSQGEDKLCPYKRVLNIFKVLRRGRPLGRPVKLLWVRNRPLTVRG